MDWTLHAEVGSRTRMSSLDIIYVPAGKGLGMRLRVAGWACNPREAGGALGIRIMPASLRDFPVFELFLGFLGSPACRDVGYTLRWSRQTQFSVLL